MTDKEYSEQLNNLKAEHNAAVRELNKQYIIENCKYKIGDIIEDHFHKIKIEKIKYAIVGLEPVFYGVELKKDGTTRKQQMSPCMYGSNIIGGWKK